MQNKVLLILVDGMRPDGMDACGHPLARSLAQQGAFTAEARSVFPPVTLPCHMSLFHSVEPQRHGVITNVYTPQARPVAGLCERLSAADRLCAMFYVWEALRDLTRPFSLAASLFLSAKALGNEIADRRLAMAARECLQTLAPDFLFLYQGDPDETAHRYGWMSEEYLRALWRSFENIGAALEGLPEEYAVILTADHGGHGRNHGEDCPEDMRIPLLIRARELPAGTPLPAGASLLDIAPTVAALLGVAPDSDWEGRSLL